MSDPRLSVISRRLEGVGRLLAVTSGKGGVGKTVVATCMALGLRDQGFKVGLLDLDFTSPTTHILLGVEGLYPEEEYGIIPPLAHGLRYMSVTHYSLDEPVPLRGVDVSNSLIELLCITRWGELDFLVVDMPPGIGDATLDVVRLIPRLEFLLVSTPSLLAFSSVRRLIRLLKEMGCSMLGLVENMATGGGSPIKKEVEELGLPYLGSIGFDPGLEEAVGDVGRLAETHLYGEVLELARRLASASP